ncbi:MAG: metallophosphoesterase [Deltaproteobacteria bacterium]|nr:MAG: metallophosphoesterase [Deltaproteobacteria bacterium]
MKVAVISDVHSNMDALSVVLDDIEGEGVAQVWCLGDLVGYNAEPDACIEEVRKRCTYVVLGNHDAAVAGHFEPLHFNLAARAAVEWTRKVLKRDNLAYLDRLPSARSVTEEILLVHGSPSDPEAYIMGISQAESELQYLFQRLRKRICFFGHTHVPVLYGMTRSGEVFHEPGEGEVRLDQENLYLINPGSVGQPRDGDPRASYLVLDLRELTVKWVRLVYDVDSAQEKVLRAGLPEFLASRLSRGM